MPSRAAPTQTRDSDRRHDLRRIAAANGEASRAAARPQPQHRCTGGGSQGLARAGNGPSTGLSGGSGGGRDLGDGGRGLDGGGGEREEGLACVTAGGHEWHRVP